MFVKALEAAVDLVDNDLDEAIRSSELAMRALAAEHAALVAVADQRGLYFTDGHHSMKGYLKATCNASNAQVAQQRKIAAAVAAAPEIGDALLTGRVGISQVLEIARIHANPRTRQYLTAVAAVYLERAEHCSADDLRIDIDQFMTLADLDGAFADMAGNVEHRTARVSEIGGAIDIQASGGDPLTAAKLTAIFEHFVQREFQRDVEARRAEHGNAADQHPLPRSARQRRFDALSAIFEAAYAAPDQVSMPEPVVNVVVDAATIDEAFTRSGLTLPDGLAINLDSMDMATGSTIIDQAAADPTGWINRRCITAAGTAIHPLLALQAAMAGHIRRVVLDSRGVVTDLGRKQRLFTGAAREAAKLLVRRCSHPGCSIDAQFADVDHATEWFEGGTTDQDNSDVRCRAHNRFKHRKRWRTQRDVDGRPYCIRPDGTVVLPVGERPPDLTIDESIRLARDRVAALT